MMLRFLSLLSLPFLMVAMSPHSKADDALPTWQTQDLGVSFSGNAIRKNIRNVVYDGEVIYSDDIDSPGNVALVCLKGSLTGAVALGPTDFGVTIQDWVTSERRRGRTPILTINGEKQKSTKWTYAPSLKFLFPQKKHLYKKLYNAAIRGDVVEVKLESRDPVRLILPKPNAAFADFGAECGLGRNKK